MGRCVSRPMFICMYVYVFSFLSPPAQSLLLFIILLFIIILLLIFILLLFLLILGYHNNIGPV